MFNIVINKRWFDIASWSDIRQMSDFQHDYKFNTEVVQESEHMFLINFSGDSKEWNWFKPVFEYIESLNNKFKAEINNELTGVVPINSLQELEDLRLNLKEQFPKSNLYITNKDGKYEMLSKNLIQEVGSVFDNQNVKINFAGETYIIPHKDGKIKNLESGTTVYLSWKNDGSISKTQSFDLVVEGYYINF